MTRSYDAYSLFKPNNADRAISNGTKFAIPLAMEPEFLDPYGIETMPVVSGFGSRLAAPEWIEQSTAQLARIAGGRGSVAGRLRNLVDLLARLDGIFECGETWRYIATGVDAWRTAEAGNESANISWSQCGSSVIGSSTSSAPEYVEATQQAQRRNCLMQWCALFYAQAGRVLTRRLLPELSRLGMRLQHITQLDASQLDWAHEQFLSRYYPILTPLAVDSGRPFPFISNRSDNLLVELQSPEQMARGSHDVLYARVKIPRAGSPLLAVPQTRGEHRAHHRHAHFHRSVNRATGKMLTTYIWSGDLVHHFIDELFPGMSLRNLYWFRVLRASPSTSKDVVPESLSAVDVHAPNTAEDVGFGTESQLPTRRKPRRGRLAERHDATPVTRLEVEAGMPVGVVRWLAEHLQVPAHGIVPTPYPLEMFGLPLLVDALPNLVHPRLSIKEESPVLASVHSQIDRKTG